MAVQLNSIGPRGLSGDNEDWGSLSHIVCHLRKACTNPRRVSSNPGRLLECDLRK